MVMNKITERVESQAYTTFVSAKTASELTGVPLRAVLDAMTRGKLRTVRRGLERFVSLLDVDELGEGQG
jgi:hypothetical protein